MIENDDCGKNWDVRKTPKPSEPNDDFHAEPYKDEPVVIPLVKRKGIGRNDPCPCNSGEKYKKCHEKADKGLLPQELRAIMQKLLTIARGIAVEQQALDEYPKDAEMNAAYDEKRQVWRIVPLEKPESQILVPNKEPMIPTRRILKPS
jgi:hypothetical protein